VTNPSGIGTTSLIPHPANRHQCRSRIRRRSLDPKAPTWPGIDRRKPWTEFVKSVEVLHRCPPRSSAKLRAKAVVPPMKKAPRMNGHLKKRGTPAEREVRSAVEGVDGWYRRQQM
jgi:hypothetical protein